MVDEIINSKGPNSTIIEKFQPSNNSKSIFYSKNYEEEKINLIDKVSNSEIGKGGFSKVYEDKYEIKVAKKIINKENEKYYNTEIKYLKILNKSEVRNNVVHLYNNKYDEKENKYIIYLELCDGNLKKFREKIIKKYKKFPLYMIQNIMKQINPVMIYLIKKKRLSYNDMKPENILYKTIDEKNDLYEFKLCDFNLIKEDISKNDITNGIAGTPGYMVKEKKNIYDGGVRVYDKELSEIHGLANVMYYLYFGEEYNETSGKKNINTIPDEDFFVILKNILTSTSDYDRMEVDEYFKNNFFYKDQNEFLDGINDKKFSKLSDEDAIDIAKKVTKIKEPKQLDYKKNIITEKISKDVEHFTSYMKNNIFYFVGYNKKENQIEIYEENKNKYEKSKERKIIKINKTINNINDILKYQDYILLLSSPICFINIENNFNQKYINKKNLFVKFITIENKKIFIYLNENNEIKSFEIVIKNNEFYIINKKSIINNIKHDEKIKNFDCFKTLNNNILIYLFTNNLIQIFDFDNKKLIFNLNQKNSSPNIKSLLLTEIDNEINVIYLTSNINNTKQLINIIKFKNENYKDKFIKLTENDNKNIERIPHHVNSLMEKIKLLNNNILIIKCPANIQYYDLKEKIFTAYSKYGTNIIDDIKPCLHNFYGKCSLGLRYYNQEKKIVNIFYLKPYSDYYYKLKSFVIKKINNEFFNETSNEYVYHINHLDSREIRLIDRLMFLNKEENEAYTFIEKKRKRD